MRDTDMFEQAVRNLIAEAQKIAGGSGSEQDVAEAKIELEVCIESTSCAPEPSSTNYRTGSRESASQPQVEIAHVHIVYHQRPFEHHSREVAMP